MNTIDLKWLYKVCEALDEFMNEEYDHRLEFQTLDDLKDMGVCYSTYDDDNDEEHELQITLNLFEKSLTVHSDQEASFTKNFRSYKEIYESIQSWTFDYLYFYGIQHTQNKGGKIWK